MFKNCIRGLSIVLLSVFYFAGCLNSRPPKILNGWHTSTAESQGYFTDSSTYFHYPQKTENITLSFGNFPLQNLKNTTNSFGEIINESLQLFKSQFLQYINFRKTFLVKFRKADLIFPFQYFW
jgi:hypothetical protein